VAMGQFGSKVNVWAQISPTLPEFMGAMIGARTNCIVEANGNYSYSGVRVFSV